jgi:hypothetical protein
MKRNIVKMTGGTVLAVLMVLTLTFSVIAQDDPKSQKGGGRLVGTWDVQVTITNCQTGAAIRTFPSISTFMVDGTMLDSTSGTPQALKTPGHGVWSHTGGSTYRFKFKAFSFDAGGNPTGWVIISHEANLNHEADAFESAGTAEVYAPNGNLIFTGCSATTATRFE